MKRKLAKLDAELTHAVRPYAAKHRRSCAPEGDDPPQVPPQKTAAEAEAGVAVPFEDMADFYAGALRHLEPLEADFRAAAGEPYEDPAVAAATRRLTKCAREHLAAAHAILLNLRYTYDSNDALDMVARAIPDCTQGMSSVTMGNLARQPQFSPHHAFYAGHEDPIAAEP